MNIRNWPMGQIMSLPDHCFGQRWPVHVGRHASAADVVFDISEAGLPEKCVIWGFEYVVTTTGSQYIRLALALGDVLPTTEIEFRACEPLFRDIGNQQGYLRVLEANSFSNVDFIPMRKFVAAGGRRLIGRFEPGSTITWTAHLIMIVSGVPTEVPDCLLSV